jgi:hypothetical protein
LQAHRLLYSQKMDAQEMLHRLLAKMDENQAKMDDY